LSRPAIRTVSPSTSLLGALRLVILRGPGRAGSGSRQRIHSLRDRH
jgi:hypothetical protein